MEGQEERRGIKLHKHSKISLKSSADIFLLRVPLVIAVAYKFVPSPFLLSDPTLYYFTRPPIPPASFHKLLYAFSNRNVS